MKIVLTDRDISFTSSDVKIEKVNIKNLKNYNGNKDVVAVVGTRAMAVECEKLSLPKLKLFQLTSAGFDGVPLKAFREKNIAVSNAGSTYSTPIAETVVFGILSFAKRLRKNPLNRRFKLKRGYSYISELEGKSVLILGAGSIGTTVAERLSGFNMSIDGYDSYCGEKAEYRRILRTKVELKAELSQYDYIVSTLPDNEDTTGMLSRTYFEKMKKTAVVVNVGRKAVFNQQDLYKALKNKELGGAVLDMFEILPNPITNPFRRLKNVMVLPGVAAISKEVKPRLDAHICKNLQHLISGEEAENVIN